MRKTVRREIRKAVTGLPTRVTTYLKKLPYPTGVIFSNGYDICLDISHRAIILSQLGIMGIIVDKTIVLSPQMHMPSWDL